MAQTKTAREALGMVDKSAETEDVQLPGVTSPEASRIDIFTPTERDGSKALTVEDAIAWMRKHLAEDDDSDEAIERISLQILNAGSADEILSTGKTTGAEEVLNIPLLVERVRYQESDEEYQQDSIGWFVILNVRRSDTKEDDVITTGARAIVLQCVALHMLGAFPRVVKIQRRKRKTRNGFYPLSMTLPV